MINKNNVNFLYSGMLKQMLSIVSLIIISFTFQPNAQQSWTIRTPLQPLNHLHDVVWTGISFVAVGDSGSVYSSSDGINWTQSSCGIDTAYLTTVAWTGNKLVAGGRYNQIFISEDGKNWSVYPIESVWVKRIVWTGNQLVAAGLDGIYTSADGKVWDKRYSKGYYDLVWNGSILVAVSENVFGSPSIITSPDGATWVRRDSGDHVYSIAWAKDRFIAIGDTGSFANNTVIYSSADGLEWKKDTIPQIIYKPCKIITAFNKLIAASSSALYTSVDGIVWTSISVNNSLYGLAFNNSKILAVGTYGKILVSSDATIWQDQSAFKIDFTTCASSESLFVVAGGKSIVTSTNGEQWSVVKVFDLPGFYQSINDIEWSGKSFRAVGSWVDSSGIQRQMTVLSENGIQWSIQDTGFAGGTNTVQWNGSAWILAGDSGKIVLMNTDGTQKMQASGIHHSLKDIVTKNSLTVCVGDSGTILTSNNDSIWVVRNANTFCNLKSICFGNQQYVAVGDSGVVLTSTDGVAWIRQVTGFTKHLRRVYHTSNVFIAVGVEGTIISSFDGKNWQKQTAPLNSDFASIAFRNNRFITVGTGSTILSSELTLIPANTNLTGEKGHNCSKVVRLFADNNSAYSATTITYVLPLESHVKMSIHNLDGRLVQVIENQVKKAGVHSVNLHRNCGNVKMVNAGCYCVKLQAEYGSAACRMLVK